MPSPTRPSRGKRAPKLDFAVTAEMIATAIPEDSAHCMIADALKAAMPQARAVAVDLATIRFTDPAAGRRYIYLTPPEAQIALLNFDHGNVPEPFVVTGHAAQIVETKKTRKEKVAASSVQAARVESGKAQISSLQTAPDSSLETTPDSSLETTPSERPKRQMARLIPNPAGGGTVPIKVGGTPPPIGPLASGTGTQTNVDPRLRLGRRRKFGLRAMGR